jgi:hypothetical protein
VNERIETDEERSAKFARLRYPATSKVAGRKHGAAPATQRVVARTDKVLAMVARSKTDREDPNLAMLKMETPLPNR